MSARYFAYHVDQQGAAKASYQLLGTDDTSALAAARYFLKFHPSLEVWQGARRIARLAREEPGQPKAQMAARQVSGRARIGWRPWEGSSRS